MKFKKQLSALVLFALFPVVTYAGDTVTININGSVTASTCDIQTTNLDFNFGDAIFSTVTKTLEYDSISKDISFNCPSGLVLQGTLQGTPYSSDNEWNIASSGTATGFGFQLHYVSSNGKSASLVFESVNSSSSKWRNLLDATSYGNNTTKTTLGINTTTIVAFIETISGASSYTAGTLTGTVTIGIRYTN